MKDDTTENMKYILIRAGFFLHPELLHKEGPATRSQVRESTWLQRVPHSKINFKRGCRKKKYDNIHDQFIRDKFFRKNDDRVWVALKRSSLRWIGLQAKITVILPHKKKLTSTVAHWWIRSNVVNFDTMPTRRQPDFKKALSTMYLLKKAEDKKHYENWSQSTSSWWQWQTTWWIPIMRIHHKDGVSTDRTGKPVYSVNQLFICGMNLSKNWMQNLSCLYR